MSYNSKAYLAYEESRLEPEMVIPKIGKGFTNKSKYKEFTVVPYVEITEADRAEFNERMFKLYGV